MPKLISKARTMKTTPSLRAWGTRSGVRGTRDRFGTGAGAGFATVCLDATGHKVPSLQTRGARGCFGTGAGAGLSSACLDATGRKPLSSPGWGVSGSFGIGASAGDGVDGIACDKLSKDCLSGDPNASQNCSTDEKRSSAFIDIAR